MSTWQSEALARYGTATVLCAAFSAIYESQSHGVFSPYMVGLCAVPLLLGVVPALLLGLWRIELGWAARQLWACCVLTLALGCCYVGVLEIYGTTSAYVLVYVSAGMLLAAAALVAGLLDHGRFEA